MKIETQMNIDLAVKHLTWRLQQPKMIPNEKDKEAFNCILTTLNQNYDAVVMEDILLAKMVAERLLFLTIGGERSMKNAIEIVKEILGTSLFDLGKQYQFHIPLIRLMRSLEDDYIKLPRNQDNTKNAIKVAEAKRLLMKNNTKKYSEQLLKPYTIDEFEAFIKRLVLELKIEFEAKG